MDFQKINATDAEKVTMRGINETGTTFSAGHLTCLHVRTLASADGIRLESPVTSALPGFHGVAAEDITSGAGSAGAVQTYGFINAFVSASGGETIAPGQVMGPVDGQVYANSSGQSGNFGPIIILSQRVGGNALNPVMVKAMGA